MDTQEQTEKQPMPLDKFISAIAVLAKQGRWAAYKEAVRRRREWFEKNGNGKVF